MSQGQKFHGLQLAANSVFANFVVEKLAVDPLLTDLVPLAAGRAWYNTASNEYKFCDIDGGGALRVNSFTTKAALAAAIADFNTALSTLSTNLTASINTEVARATGAEGVLTAGLATEVSDRIAAITTEANARIAADAVVAADAAAADTVVVANASDALSSEASIRAAADVAGNLRMDGLQTEINTVETSLGLNSDGTYTAPANTNYLGTVTTQKEADVALDVAIAAEVTRATAAETTITTALNAEAATRAADDANLQSQLTAYINAAVTSNANADAAEAARAIAAEAALTTEINAVEVSVGLGVDGALAAITDTNYVNGAPTILAAIKALDTVLKTDTDGLAAETLARTNADTTQTAALSAESAARASADTATNLEINAIETAAGLNGDGTYVTPVGTNYLDTTTTLAGADYALDAAVKVNANAITAINTVALPGLQDQVTAEVARATAAESAESAARTTAINTVTAAVTAEQTRATGVEATLTASIGSEVTRATGAEGGLQTQIDALVASAGSGAAALQTSLNAKRYTYISSAPALVHTVTHNLGTQFYSANIMVKGTDGVWRNDIMPVEDIDTNSYKITLSEAADVKASGQSNAAV